MRVVGWAAVSLGPVSVLEAAADGPGGPLLAGPGPSHSAEWPLSPASRALAEPGLSSSRASVSGLRVWLPRAFLQQAPAECRCGNLKIGWGPNLNRAPTTDTLRGTPAEGAAEGAEPWCRTSPATTRDA